MNMQLNASLTFNRVRFFLNINKVFNFQEDINILKGAVTLQRMIERMSSV